MKETNNNKKGYLSDIERYVRGEMSPKEENSFKRKLMNDPFSDEVADAYSGIRQNKSLKGLDPRENKVKERISPKQRRLYYRIATSVAAILILVSVSVLFFKKRSEARIADMFIPAKNIEAFQPSPASDSYFNYETMQENTIQDEAETVSLQASVNEAARAQEAYNPTTAEPQSETGLISETVNTEASLNDYKQTGLESDSAGYAVESSELQPDAPAQPAEGQENYSKYIKENIRRPAATESMDNAVVVVSFNVLSSGDVENINIVNTPGNEFSEEASRLIREGPAWLPAIKNGEKADDNVMLRVVFK